MSNYLQKLDFYVIRGLPKQWFCPYLPNKTQFDSIGNSFSYRKPMACGVPQSSELGHYHSSCTLMTLSIALKLLFDFHILTYGFNLFTADKKNEKKNRNSFK